MEMVRDFYHSDAVDHVVGDQVLHRTFLDAVGQEPSLWGLVLWDGGQAVGFSYLTSFYACECGGKTLMIEEIYLKESCRGKGLWQAVFPLAVPGVPPGETLPPGGNQGERRGG